MGLVLMKILVFVATTGWLFMRGINEVKEPFDNRREPFLFKTDYWPYYWDNVGIMLFGCILGFALSNELGVPLIEAYFELSELAEKALDLTAIMVSTLVMGFLLEFAYKRGGKRKE